MKKKFIIEDGTQHLVEIDDDGNQFWSVKKKLHRLSGPAISNVLGYQEWFLQGKRHRKDGPAIPLLFGINKGI